MDLSLPELEALINEWRAQRPASGNEFELAPEVNVLAAVYAHMIFKRIKTLPLTALDASARQLLETWRLRQETS